MGLQDSIQKTSEISEQSKIIRNICLLDISEGYKTMAKHIYKTICDAAANQIKNRVRDCVGIVNITGDYDIRGPRWVAYKVEQMYKDSPDYLCDCEKVMESAKDIYSSKGFRIYYVEGDMNVGWDLFTQRSQNEEHFLTSTYHVYVNKTAHWQSVWEILQQLAAKDKIHIELLYAIEKYQYYYKDRRYSPYEHMGYIEDTSGEQSFEHKYKSFLGSRELIKVEPVIRYTYKNQI